MTTGIRFSKRSDLISSRYFVAIFPGHIEIQENEVGTRSCRTFTDLAQEFHRILAIGRGVDVGGIRRILQCFLHDHQIRRVVFHD